MVLTVRRSLRLSLRTTSMNAEKAPMNAAIALLLSNATKDSKSIYPLPSNFDVDRLIAALGIPHYDMRARGQPLN